MMTGAYSNKASQ